MIHYTGALEKRAHTAISYSRIFVITGAFYNTFELKKLLLLEIISRDSISRVVLNWILIP